MKPILCASVPLYRENKKLCFDIMEEARRIGMRGVEFKLGEDSTPSEDVVRWAGRTAEEMGLMPYAHLPYLHGEANIASPHLAQRSLAEHILIDALSQASMLGCELVNTHLGTRRGGGMLEIAARELEHLEDIASGMGLRLSVENQEVNCMGVVNTPEDVLRLTQLVPGILLTYDVGHGNTHGYNVAQFLPAVLPRLAYLHVHDNDGSFDQHLPLGSGNVDFQLLVSSLRRNASSLPEMIPVVFELQLDGLAPSVRYFRKLWREAVGS